MHTRNYIGFQDPYIEAYKGVKIAEFQTFVVRDGWHHHTSGHSNMLCVAPCQTSRVADTNKTSSYRGNRMVNVST